MESVSSYLLRIIAAAMIISILTALVDRKGSIGTLIRVMGGLFLTLTIIQPLIGFDWSYLTAFAEDFSAEGEAAAAQGEIMAQEEYQSIIKQRLEAYILDKAKDYEADLEVHIELRADNPPSPSSVQLRGAVSPYAKIMLQEMIEEELGIRKEDQKWIG